MSLEPEQKPATGEVQLTPDQKLDAYIATLKDKHEFDIMKDQVEFLIVERSSDATHPEPWPDNGWMLTITGVDKKGVTVGIVEKLLDPKDETPARKKINLAEAFAYTEEVLRNKAPKAAEDLGGQALDVVGVKSPDTADESAYVDHLKHLQVTRLDAAEVKETVVSSALVDSLVDGIEQAGKGKLTNGKGDHVYSAAEIKKQYKSFAEKLGNPDVDIDNLLKFIPRAGGLRDAVEVALKNGSVEDVKKAIADSLNKSLDAVVNQESQESIEAVSEPQSDIEQLKKALDEASASLPEKDRGPAWQYAAALHSYEEEAALRKMSTETRDSRAFMPYVRLFRQLQDALSKAK